MADLPPKKALTVKAIENMKSSDNDKSDMAENRGLRVTCGVTGVKTFFYRYTSPFGKGLVQMKIGHFPTVSLAQARAKLQELKQIRREGRCPATEQREAIQQAKLLASQKGKVFTVADLIEYYLTQRIEDRQSAEGKIIPGARNKTGQYQVRIILYKHVVKVMGERAADTVTRKDVVDLILGIVERGHNVVANKVLIDFSLAYEFALGTGKLPEDFVNPVVLAKASIRQTKIKLRALEVLRRLHDKAGVGVVLAGMPRLIINLKGKKGEYAQLYSGFGCRGRRTPSCARN